MAHRVTTRCPIGQSFRDPRTGHRHIPLLSLVKHIGGCHEQFCSPSVGRRRHDGLHRVHRRPRRARRQRPRPPPTSAGRDRLPDLIAGHDRPAHGRAVVEMLGDRLPEAARRNGMAAERLREILVEDPSAWLDGDARLYYQEPARTEGASSSPTAEAAAPAPLEPDLPAAQQARLAAHDLPRLRRARRERHGLEHQPRAGRRLPPGLDASTQTGPPSAPRSGRRSRASGSEWPRTSRRSTSTSPPRTPEPAALTRSDAADQVYGTRALISPSTNAASKLCSGGCGGIAYVGVFDTANSTPTTSRPGSSPSPWATTARASPRPSATRSGTPSG